jgi:hypothetical protein
VAFARAEKAARSVEQKSKSKDRKKVSDQPAEDQQQLTCCASVEN